MINYPKLIIEKFRTLFRSRRDLLVSISALAGSGVFISAISIICSIVQGRYISPSLLGYFGKFSIITGYLSFLHLGTYLALQRDFPYYMGRNERERAVHLAEVCLGWTYIISIISAIVLLSLAVIRLYYHDIRGMIGWLSHVIICILTFYSLYLNSIYRTSNEFVIWSKSIMINSLSSLVVLPTVIFGFTGLCLRATLPQMVGLLYAHKHRPLKIKPMMDLRTILESIKFGIQLHISNSLITTITDNTMKLFILKSLGSTYLGFYVFSIPILLAVNRISLSIEQVFTPRITLKFGETDDFHHCVKGAFKGMIFGLIIVIPILFIVQLIIPPFVIHLIPKYTQAIPIASVLIWATLARILEIPTMVLYAAKDARALIISAGAGFACFCFISIIAIYYQAGINYLLFAYIFGKISYTLISYIFLFSHTKQQNLLVT